MGVLEKVSGYCRNVHNFVYEGSLSIYELLLKVIVKEDEIVDYVNTLKSTVDTDRSNINTKVNANQVAINAKVDANQLTMNAKVDANQLAINATVDANRIDINSKVDANYTDLNTRKENSVDITNLRKLSTTGNFTGQIQGVESLFVLAEITSSTDKIDFLTDQFADGATGLVIDCGFFEDDAIDKNYDGGVWA